MVDSQRTQYALHPLLDLADAHHVVEHDGPILAGGDQDEAARATQEVLHDVLDLLGDAHGRSRPALGVPEDPVVVHQLVVGDLPIVEERPDEDAEQMQTVGDAIRYLQDKE